MSSSRLVILHQTYHHGPSLEKPIVAESRASFPTVDEAAYIRPMKANTEWHLLDYGWLDKVSFVLIKAKERVELTFNGDSPQIVVPPGCESFFMPTGSVHIRGGEYTIYVFPELGSA